jgi:transposase
MNLVGKLKLSGKARPTRRVNIPKPGTTETRPLGIPTIFEVFVEKFLVPELWSGAVVIMDNLSAHKLASITTMIESVGAKIICLSPYSPDFNPIELWWSQLKSFLRSFSPTTTEMVDTIIAVALKLMNPQHLRNWFANCCYCTS